MTDDLRALEALRETTRQLRLDPDEAMLLRVRTAVRARMAVQSSPWDVLAGWLRPAAITLGAIVILLAAAISVAPDAISPAEMAAMTGRMIVDQESRLVVP